MRHLILGSASPRRRELLQRLGIEDLEVRPANVDEPHPEEVAPKDMALFLARHKADALLPGLSEGELLLTADTVVLLDDQILDKPVSEEDARDHLRRLSDRSHRVITGLVLTDGTQTIEQSVETEVSFAPLTEDDITYYIRHCHVMDKAGGYGIQDWIGLAAVERINGSYTNVMGLPTAEVYSALSHFL